MGHHQYISTTEGLKEILAHSLLFDELGGSGSGDVGHSRGYEDLGYGYVRGSDGKTQEIIFCIFHDKQNGQGVLKRPGRFALIFLLKAPVFPANRTH